MRISPKIYKISQVAKSFCFSYLSPLCFCARLVVELLEFVVISGDCVRCCCCWSLRCTRNVHVDLVLRYARTLEILSRSLSAGSGVGSGIVFRRKSAWRRNRLNTTAVLPPVDLCVLWLTPVSKHECEWTRLVLYRESDTNRGHGGFLTMVEAALKSRGHASRNRVGGQNHSVNMRRTGLC